MKMIIVAAILAAMVGRAAEIEELQSPNGKIAVAIQAKAERLSWSVKSNGREVIAPSRLGIEFTGIPLFGKSVIEDVVRTSMDSVWTNRLYRKLEVRDHYNEMLVWLRETEIAEKCREKRRIGVRVRAYDEGVAFRYEIPEQIDVPGFQILKEYTEWNFKNNPQIWATSVSKHENSQEGMFGKTRLNEVTKRLLGMPVLVETEGQTLAITEAALSNWSGMFFHVTNEGLASGLSPLPPSGASTKDVAVIRTTPAASPWRVVMIANNELDLLTKNDIILNLNPPPAKEYDFSWVKPGASTWDWWVESNNSLSTELTLELVDFAAEMGWPYHTIDGGWYGFARRPNHGPDVKVECRPNFDLAKIVQHAEAKGVGIFVWLHWQALEDNGIEETLTKLEKWGVKGIKLDFHDRQDQWMVCWFEKVCRLAAKHHILVNFHGAFKPTGTERTWPNNITREGILGNEMNKFSTRITPRHSATLPYTRLLLGPGDFTPGSFGNVFSKDFIPQGNRGHLYGDETDRREIWAEEMGTRAHAIALCIAYDGGLTTMCDWPKRYRGAPGIEALRALPAVWKATRPIAGKCGEYYAVVRESHEGKFYFAAFTDKARVVDLKLDFLGEGKWMMDVFADDSELTPADAKEIAIASRVVTAKDRPISFGLLNEGGAVAIFTRIMKESK